MSIALIATQYAWKTRDPRRQAQKVQALHKQPLSSAEALALMTDCGICVQVWLQEFAWTEEDKEEDMKSRSASTGKLSAKDASSLQKQPMFCMETAVNMFYWSVLVYDHEEVMHQTDSLPSLMP